MTRETSSPEDTQALLTRLEALLPRIHALPPFDIGFTDVLGLPVHLTVRCTDLGAMNFGDLKEWGQLDFCHTHQGKGETPEQSRLSCIMEAVERYSAAHPALEGKIIQGPFKDMGPEALAPDLYHIPPGIDYSPDRVLTWYQGRDQVSGEMAAAPIDFVMMDLCDSAFPFQGFESQRLGFFLSNGLAAGANLDDALMSGICEVVERDAQHRVFNNLSPRPVELDVRHDPTAGPWLERFEEKGLTLRLFALDHEPGFFTVFAVSWDSYCKMLVTGSACDTHPGPAMRGAILELAQQRAFMFFKSWKTRRDYLPIIRYIRERIPPDRYRSGPPATFWTECCPGPVKPSDLNCDHGRDLRATIDILTQSGRRVTGFDLTHPDLGIPVVRVMITGLKNGYQDFQPALGFVE